MARAQRRSVTLLALAGSLLLGSARPPSAPRRDPAHLAVDFQEADLRDVILDLAEAAGVNVVIAEGVTGKVTLKLTDADWKDALRAVLQTHHLAMKWEGEILRIDTAEALRRPPTGAPEKK